VAGAGAAPAAGGAGAGAGTAAPADTTPTATLGTEAAPSGSGSDSLTDRVLGAPAAAVAAAGHLPFTGLALGLVVLIALAVIAFGLIAHRGGRRNDMRGGVR